MELNMSTKELMQMDVKHLGRMLKMGYKGDDYNKIYKVFIMKSDPELYDILKKKGEF